MRILPGGGYVFPQVCSRCAAHKATTWWKIESETRAPLPFQPRHPGYALDVPVCQTCRRKLEQVAWLRRAAVWSGGLLGLVLGVALLQALVGQAVNGPLFFLGLLLGLALGLALAVYAVVPAIDHFLRGQVGRMTAGGLGVRFHNRAYQQLFIRLNAGRL